MTHLRYSFKYLVYILFSKHKKGHSIHSPFVFKLVTDVFNNKNKDEELIKVIDLHKQFKKSRSIIEYSEIGAGSVFKNNKKNVGKIVKQSSVEIKYGKLLYNLIKYFNPENILEIGTSVGISSAYIAQANKNANFISIEGIQAKIKIAEQIKQSLNQNTDFVHGNFDNTLDVVINNINNLDFVFFDGNHTKKSTLEYFYKCLPKSNNNSIFIFDDIHWSKEMEAAWIEIKKDPSVKVSIDLFRMGLIFFKKELSTEHYIIKF